ncbi:MAG: TrbI/VirB10 family protein, partial [Amphiplicatus sp.]|nr:TrbI/VirB10 family protein [Amphiplicatus sp.]
MSALPKEEPEALELRAKPRPVTRLNRNALMVAAGGAAILIFGAMSIALKPPRAVGEAGAKELYNVDTKPTAEGLDALPKSYADVKPQLGAPLPGDLGAALLQAEQAVAASGDDGYLAKPNYAALSPTPFRNSPEADAARDAALREAQIAAEAREAGVFFQLMSRDINASRGNPSPSTAQLIEALAGSPFDFGLGPQPIPFGAEREQDPGRQIRKLDFLEEGAQPSTDNPYAIEDPITPFEVMASTVIPASLITGVNSDLPGTVIAQITEHTYDTVTGQYLLVPQGSRLIGRYDSNISFGQDRALVVWQR